MYTATLRRVRVSSELSPKRTLATPITRTKTLGLSEVVCNHQATRDGRFCKARIELTVERVTPPRHIVLCYVYTNARTCTANHTPLSILLHFSRFPHPFFRNELRRQISPETRNLHRIHAPAIPGSVFFAKEMGDATIISFTSRSFMCELD